MLFVAACGGATPGKPAVGNDVAPVGEASPQQLAAQSERGPDRVSTYTKLSEAACKLIDENTEEGPYWLRRCTGPDGWAVEWGESDLRQGLVLRSAAGKEADLELSDKVANGAFNILGPVIEWRGPKGGPADVLIVRMDVTDNANPERPPKSRLSITRLAPSPCLVAIVDPAPGQNEKARAIADGALPECIAS
jgi:hypothetical protein